MSSTASTGWEIMPLSFDNGWSTPGSMPVATQGNSARTTRPSQAGHGTISIKPGALTANQNGPEQHEAGVPALPARSSAHLSLAPGLHMADGIRIGDLWP